MVCIALSMVGGLGLGGTIHLERHLSLLTVLVPRISSMNTRDIRVLSRHYDDHVDPASKHGARSLRLCHCEHEIYLGGWWGFQ